MQGCLSSALFGLVLYIASWFVLHSIAHCQAEPPAIDLSAECAPEVQLRRALFEFDGQPGIWFAEPVAACMASRLRLAVELAEIVRLHELRAEEGDVLTESLRAQVALGREIEARLSEQLEHALRRAREAEDARDSVVRRPALWFALGVITSGALVFAASAARSR